MHLFGRHLIGGLVVFLAVACSSFEATPTRAPPTDTPISATPTPSPSPTPTPTSTPVPPTPTPTPTLLNRAEAATVQVIAAADLEGLMQLHEANWQQGYGFIFDVEDRAAFIATAYHVVALDRDGVTTVAQLIAVEADPSRPILDAVFLGGDPDLDVAVLSICCSDNFQALRWEPGAPRVGERVFIVDIPRLGDPYAVSGRIEEDDDVARLLGLLPHSVPMPEGSSGSALVTEDGTVLGINTRVRKDGTRAYAVPYTDFADLIAEWRSRLVTS